MKWIRLLDAVPTVTGFYWLCLSPTDAPEIVHLYSTDAEPNTMQIKFCNALEMTSADFQNIESIWAGPIDEPENPYFDLQGKEYTAVPEMQMMKRAQYQSSDYDKGARL